MFPSLYTLYFIMDAVSSQNRRSYFYYGGVWPYIIFCVSQSNVSITGNILLDQDLDVGFIDISGSGKLVFGRGRAIKLTTMGIMVRDTASLIIGSEDCRHTDDVSITLKGKQIRGE